MSSCKYWISVVSKEHVLRGVSGCFIQVCHGIQAPLKRMNQNDWIVLYSPKLSMIGKETCKAFTAIGQAIDNKVYQFQMSPGFRHSGEIFYFMNAGKRLFYRL